LLHSDEENLFCTSSTVTSTAGMDQNEYEFEWLPIEFWDRSEDCKEAKLRHMRLVDHFCGEDRERLVLLTTLNSADTVLEPNMFPCKVILLHRF